MLNSKMLAAVVITALAISAAASAQEVRHQQKRSLRSDVRYDNDPDSDSDPTTGFGPGITFNAIKSSHINGSSNGNSNHNNREKKTTGSTSTSTSKIPVAATVTSSRLTTGAAGTAVAGAAEVGAATGPASAAALHRSDYDDNDVAEPKTSEYHHRYHYRHFDRDPSSRALRAKIRYDGDSDSDPTVGFGSSITFNAIESSSTDTASVTDAGDSDRVVFGDSARAAVADIDQIKIYIAPGKNP